MIKLITLIIACIILFVIFILVTIIAFVKKTKRFFIVAFISFLLLFTSGLYTIHFGLKKGKEKATQIAKKSIEKIYPTFDSEIPDTEANKKNFRNFLKVDVTTDVKNIYCFDDVIGQDADYMFAFSCDSTTAQTVIKRHELMKDTIIGNSYSESLQSDFFWWDKKHLHTLESYSWNSDTDRKNVHKIFWYDKKNKKAFYFEFDL